MKLSVGEYWRQSSDERLSRLLLDYTLDVLETLGIDTEVLDTDLQYDYLLEYFNAEYEKNEFYS